MTKQSPPFFTRLQTYLTEMFPAAMYLPFVLVMYLCLTLIVQALNMGEVIVDQYAVVGAVSAFFVMLLIRNFDDLKDYELDKNIFPERPIPRGDVKINDVKMFAVFSASVLIIINLLFAPKSLVVFTGMMVYAGLTFKWFFAKEYHLKHVFFTMLTHQPLPIIINVYLLFTALSAGGVTPNFGWIHLAVLFMFSLPITAWETSRKIRAATHETDYQTFSKIFGASKAAFIPLTLFTVATALAIFIGTRLGLTTSYILLALIFYAVMAVFYLRFIRNPIHKNNVLKSVAMGYAGVLLLHLLIQLLFKYSIQLQF